MIKLFITDLDGCISTPFVTPSWKLLSEIRQLNERHTADPSVPPLTICSGRPLSYVEAVAQWLNISRPVVFESAGLYSVERNKVRFLPAFNEKAEQQVGELKEWLRAEVIAQKPDVMLEFTKKMDAGLIHPDRQVIEKIYPDIKGYINRHYPLFEVHKTDVSVNIILTENNKRQGILELCRLAGIAPENAAYIGDSSGDIPGLETVGYPFAPLNATDQVKACAEVLEAEVTEAVLEAYRRIIQINREEEGRERESAGRVG